MVRKLLFTLTTTALVAVSFLLGSTYSLFQGRTGRKVAEVTDRIRSHYPLDVPVDKLERAAIQGLLGTLDPWSQYFTAQEWRDWSARVMSGRFHGVGIRVESDAKTGYLRVTSPIENTPAFEAGILPGDLIVGVDGADIQNQPQDEVISRIKGDAGTRVVLTLRREDYKDPFDVTLVRAEIKIQAVKHKLLESGIGYIRIEDFTESVPVDVAAAWRDLESKGMKALAIDLRFNGGGLLKAAIELCDLWLPANQVVAMSEGKRAEYRRTYRTEHPEAFPAAPIVILVNRGTASASEIVAGALRDHGLATLAGTRTFGKGLVQSSFDLADGSHLKLTTARWVTPNGEQVGAKDPKSEAGLAPDYFVEMSGEEDGAVIKRWFAEGIVKGPPISGPPPRDYVLEAGVEALKAKLAGRAPNIAKREVPKPAAPEPK
ncbi:MAG TPA: S41 family peptidase [Candidatus Eisenbacteria bacterium]|nr:S41 family peptidase [Candidatus Eisenbacteria bacterium]